jgi:hypothetical protein
MAILSIDISQMHNKPQQKVKELLRAEDALKER